MIKNLRNNLKSVTDKWYNLKNTKAVRSLSAKSPSPFLSETREQATLNLCFYCHDEGFIHRLESNFVAHNSPDLSSAWEHLKEQ